MNSTNLTVRFGKIAIELPERKIVKCEANARNVEKRFFSRNLCRQSRKQFSSLEIFIRSTRILSNPHCICPDLKTLPRKPFTFIIFACLQNFFPSLEKIVYKIFQFSHFVYCIFDEKSFHNLRSKK